MENKVNSDLLKGMAIIAVVAIHSFSKFVGASPLYLFIDQLSRFAVPLFVAISGFGLAMSFSKHSLKDFYLRRVLKLLPLFLFASVVILIYKNLFDFGTFDLLNWHTWVMILRGQADYHLYFVPMIFSLYVIFPILFYIVNKLPKLSLILALIIQIIWYELSAGMVDQIQYVIPLSWIFYFVLGIYLSKNKLNFPPLIIIGFILMFFQTLLLQSSGTDMILATRFTRLPVILYSTGFILWGFSLNSRFKVLDFLGRYSYQIYLFHTIALRIIFAIIDKYQYVHS